MGVVLLGANGSKADRPGKARVAREVRKADDGGRGNAESPDIVVGNDKDEATESGAVARAVAQPAGAFAGATATGAADDGGLAGGADACGGTKAGIDEYDSATPGRADCDCHAVTGKGTTVL